jgi:hypothetical protein
MSRRAPIKNKSSNALLIITALAAIGFIAVGIVLVMQVIAPNNSGAGARLAVDQEKIDLGTFAYEQPARAVFTLKNIGDQPLQIANRQIQTKLLEGC